ncbi:MAG TPA: heavy metal translocating P-type ATPase [Thermoanaerobaculia bacterium]|jgi:Cd2+/Zn2+-exporting ATPase|nr:heavy metal translocating P-type ATPase [Thermoanaerobaculia bacterium]
MSTEGHQFKIRGMDCAEEVAILKREIGPLVGGAEHLSFDLLKAKMTVLSAGSQVNPREVVKAVERTGMGALVWEDDAERLEPESFWLRRGRTVLTAGSGAFAFAGFAFHAALAGGISRALGSEGMGIAAGPPLASRSLYSLAILLGVWSVLPKAWNALRRFRPDMNLLMTIAVLGAVAIGEWFEGATVAFLFSLSLALESWSIGRARRAVEALMDLTPQTARVRQPDGHELEIPAEEVEIGAVLLVKPGERIPLDGRVTGGASEVNQAPITGESVPVPKEAGAEVFAGTINGDGALEIEATKRAGDSTLAHIIRLVDEAQSRRAPSEQWVEKFARVYTPVVLALALAVLLLPPLVLGGAWNDWIYRSLVLLVIACPCALVISTPVSIVAALASAAKNGVLVKGGLFLEIPSRLKAVALDKTGTLTWGKPEVIEIVPLAGHDERELLERVGALETRSEHPLARAILAFAKHRGVVVRPAEDFRILQGKGASGRFDGKEYWLGSHRYLEERGQETPEIHQRLEEMSQAGRTAVVVGTADHVCGLIAVADSVRPESARAIATLREAGILSIVMLTGDNRGTAEAIARETGIDDVRAEMLPAEKVAAIDQLLARYGAVAMIGDGVNDAPAMARATMSVAMGAAGSDAAIEVADVALMSDDLAKLPWLIKHSRRTLGVIRQNIVFSLAIKAIFVVLTVAGHASLWAAIAADMGASLLVIANGLRLLAHRAG